MEKCENCPIRYRIVLEGDCRTCPSKQERNKIMNTSQKWILKHEILKGKGPAIHKVFLKSSEVVMRINGDFKSILIINLFLFSIT